MSKKKQFENEIEDARDNITRLKDTLRAVAEATDPNQLNTTDFVNILQEMLPTIEELEGVVEELDYINHRYSPLINDYSVTTEINSVINEISKEILGCLTCCLGENEIE